MISATELSSALDVVIDTIVNRVVQRLAAGQHADWVDQGGSPLGPRRHRAAVLRRIAAGQPGATKIGRRHLLSRDALEAELAAAADKAPVSPSVADELRRELRLVGR